MAYRSLVVGTVVEGARGLHSGKAYHYHAFGSGTFKDILRTVRGKNSSS